MSDHERGPEDDEEETTPAAKRPKFDQTESRAWPGHVRFNTPKKATLALLKSTPSLFVAPTKENTLWDLDASSSGTQSPRRVSHTFACISTKSQKDLML
jgi:hypothetical protein